MNKLKLSTIFLIAVLVNTQANTTITHIVRRGETLSEILYRYDIKPLYGKNGSVLRTINSNPQLKSSKGNSLEPGQGLKLYSGKQSIKAEKLNSISRTFKSSDRLTTSFYSGYLGVKGKDHNGSSGEILSKLYHGVGLEWSSLLTKNYKIEFSAAYWDVEIQDSQEASLVNKDQNIKKVGSSLERKIGNYNIELGYSLRDQIFYRAISTNNYKVHTVTNHQVYITAESRIYQLRQSSFNLGLGLNYNNYNSPEDLIIKPGTGYLAFIQYEKTQAKKSLGASLYFETNGFESSGSSMEYSSLFFKLDYGIELFEGESL